MATLLPFDLVVIRESRLDDLGRDSVLELLLVVAQLVHFVLKHVENAHFGLMAPLVLPVILRKHLLDQLPVSFSAHLFALLP